MKQMVRLQGSALSSVGLAMALAAWMLMGPSPASAFTAPAQFQTLNVVGVGVGSRRSIPIPRSCSREHQKKVQLPVRARELAALPPGIVVMEAASTSASTAANSAALWTYFWEAVITNGIPAAFSLLVIGVAAFLFKSPRGGNEIRALEESVFGQKNPVSILYQDLYGDQDQFVGDKRKPKTIFQRLFKGGGGGMGMNSPSLATLPQNIGVPAEQYIRLTHLNKKYDSYTYSLTAATQSRAAAAAQFRQAAFARVWKKALTAGSTTTLASSTTSASVLLPATTVTTDKDGDTAAINYSKDGDDSSTETTTTTTTTSTTSAPAPVTSTAAFMWQQLQRAEQEFLRKGKALSAQLQALQTQLTQETVDTVLQEMQTISNSAIAASSRQSFFGRNEKYNGDDDSGVYQLDPPPLLLNANGGSSTTNEANTSTITKANGEAGATTSSATEDDKHANQNKKYHRNKGRNSQVMKAIEQTQRALQELELEFVTVVIQIVGPEQAVAVRTALLGDIAVRGSGSLLRDLQERPLTRLLSSGDNGSDATIPVAPKVFVMRFPGDVTASQVATLREEVTAIVNSARANVDEALVILQSGGGTVTGYGLAAAQLLRFKDAGLKLTVAVEQVAASGGYMMCCVADHIVASPFAVLGSIGVISDIPNVYERLKQEGIEFQTVTAGKFKRTLTPTKKVTKEDYDKTKKDIEEIFFLFRDFVAQNRPQLDIESVATGETWFGTAALERKLCDEIKAVDDVIMGFVRNGYDVYEVEYVPPVDTLFGRITPANADSTAATTSDSGLIGQGVRWFIRTVASELKAEFGKDLNSYKPIQERYMMLDDRADRVRSQD